MKRRATRILTALALIAAAAAFTHQAITRSQAVSDAAEQLAAISGDAARADLALAELNAAERGYVAPGQGLDFWAARIDEQLAIARETLESLGASDALMRLRDFQEIDDRARQYVGARQQSLASDLIFADGFEIVGAARNELALAVAARRASLTGARDRDRRIHLASLAGLGVCALIASLLLLRTPKGDEVARPVAEMAPAPSLTSSISASEDSIGAALDASLDRFEPIEPIEPIEPQPEPTEPTEPAEPRNVSLPAAADICVDLGRLLDARDLQAVLGRIAEVLGARGLVIWLADQATASLTPALTHGFAPAVVARMGALSIDEDNATSTACRTKTMQIVTGALAAPLLTPEGCTGVLAAEFRDGRERASDVQSLTRIVSAQLASGIAAPGADTRRAAEA